VKRLYVIDGPMKGKSFALTDGVTTIGRSSENDICISDMGVSRHHAKFLKKDGKILIVDLSTFQGLFIDGEKIEPGLEVEIKKENTIKMGNTILSFQEELPARALAQPSPINAQRKPFDTSKSVLAKDSSREDYIRSLELLLGVSNIFAGSLNIDELLDEVIDKVFNFLKRIDRGVILLVNKETGTLQEAVSKTRMDDKKRIFSKVNYSRTIVNRAMKDGKPVIMGDTSRVDKTDLSNSMAEINVRSVMCVPLTYKEDIKGVIYVDSIGLPGGFRKDDLEALTVLSNTAAIAIENARLYETLKQELAERRRAEEALQKARNKLEEQVKKRTAELSKSVQLLKREITGRKRTEEALRESEAKFRLLAENIQDVFWISTPGIKEMMYVSPAYEKIWGRTRDSLYESPQSFIEAIHPEDRGRVIAGLKEHEKGSWNFEYRIIQPDGCYRWIQDRGFPIRDEQGSLIWMCGVAADLTERKQLEAQLRQAQKLEALGTLAGGIAHNFNNLLMAMKGNASLMLLEADPAHPNYEKLKTIEELVSRGARLTSQLLGYAREGTYQIKPIDVNQLVKETSDTFGATRKEIRIHQEFAGDLLGIMADQAQIEQVLINLYVNAADAMPRGGDLFLKTMNVTDRDMPGRAYRPKPGTYVLIMVRDTGIGMDKKTMERIFDPFFTTKGLYKGTGLGLASVYGTIKAHGGYIEVDSKKGQGTIFSIYLPASEKEVTEEKVFPEKIPRGKETLLLVDDEDVILDVGAPMLRTLGYKVLLARSGKEAIELYRENQDKIALVVLDMIMPEMGGGETYDKMKEIDPDIKVLLSSGYSIEGQATEILERGCDGFIQKPFDMKELSQELRRILDRI
jgi:two-component system cell cycle sensor histidine kinase/response regulator CckA